MSDIGTSAPHLFSPCSFACHLPTHHALTRLPLCRNLSERVPGPAQTNNRAELLGIIRALETCPWPDLKLEVRTDSQYAIDCKSSRTLCYLR